MFSSNTSQVSNDAVFVEDVFSTWLYTGTGSNLTITNGIDLSGNGGLVWIKRRSTAEHHHLSNTVSGPLKFLCSNKTDQEFTDSNGVQSFGSTGFVLGNRGDINALNETYTSWTFRKQPKFFDVVTWTGNGTGPRQIAHNLGSQPAFMMLKRLDASENWQCYHKSNTSPNANWYDNLLRLNTTGASSSDIGYMGEPTSTHLSLDPTNSWFNINGRQYVAYLFAHNAGGFGLTGTDNVISCGSYTTDGSGNATVNLGYEPQWIMAKNTTSADSWLLVDTMRGFVSGPAVNTSDDARLYPNLDNAEILNDFGRPTATGFEFNTGTTNKTYIYIAIRRGPMKTPTSGTSVFMPVTYTGNGSTTRTVNTTITPDAAWFFHRDMPYGEYWYDRLRGNNLYLGPSSTGAEGNFGSTAAWAFSGQNAMSLNASADYINGSGALNGLWALKRAPGFFDEVCYTGDGSAKTLNHNLGVTPELIINKNRSGTDDWYTTTASLTNPDTYVLTLNTTNSQGNTGVNFIYNRTASAFSVFSGLSNPGQNYVNYLFASCPGVSKVGSYTGNGLSQTINCGFTSGARFVLIKRTDSTGDWYVWDTARGIVSANDPRLSLNSTAAEVTTDDSIDPDNSGFIVNQVSATNINVSSATYIYLAIA